MRDPQPGDAESVATALRAADRAEIAATSGEEPLPAIRRALAQSEHTFALAVGEEVIALAGIAPLNLVAGEGSPWLLGTDAFKRNARAATALCRSWLERTHILYPAMVNYVDERNVRSIRWLEGLGFTFAEPEPYGIHGLPFRRFEMRS